MKAASARPLMMKAQEEVHKAQCRRSALPIVCLAVFWRSSSQAQSNDMMREVRHAAISVMLVAASG